MTQTAVRPAPAGARRSGPRRRWDAAALGTVGLLLLALDHPLPAILAALLLAGQLVRAGTHALSVLLAVPLLAGATCTLLTATSLLHLELDARAVLAVGTAGLAAAVALSGSAPKRPVLSAEDVTATVVALMTFALFYRPFAGASTGTRLALLSSTTDAGNHLHMVRAVVRTGAYLTLAPGLDENLRTGMAQYPPALAGDLGMLLQALLGREPSVSAFVHACVIALLAVYAVVAWFGTRLALATVRALGGPLSLPQLLVTASGSLLFLSAGLSPLMLRDACYAQLLATSALLATALVLLLAPHGGPRVTVGLGLITVLAMQAWYLVAPVLAVLWLGHLATSATRRPVQALVLAVTGLLSLFPVLTGPGGHHLNAQGFVDAPPALPLLTLALVLLGSLAHLLTRRTGAAARRILAGTTALLLATAAGIGVVQVVTLGHVDYYAVKVLYSTILVGGFAAGASAGLLAAPKVKQTGPLRVLTSRALAATLVLVPLLCVVSSADLRHFVSGRLPLHADASTLDAQVARYPEGIGSSTDAWIAGGCSRGSDFIETKWLYDLSLGWSGPREDVLQAFLEGDRLYRVLAREAQARRVEVYVHDPCQRDRLDQLTRAGVRVLGTG